MTHPMTTLITVTYNSARHLRAHWTEPIPPGVEWIVVDNGSSDDSVIYAQSLGAEVIHLHENIGFGRANNIGVAKAKAKVVGLVNPDVTVDFADLSELCAAVIERRVLLAPQLLNSDGTRQPNGRGYPSPLDKVLNRLWPSQAAKRGYQKYAHPGETLECRWLTGAVIFARRELLTELGPFDPSFFVYYEDVDLGIRAGKRGIPSRLMGDVQWVHGWAREASGLNLRGWFRELSGATRFYRKHPQMLVIGNKP